ncbi:MAG TPA: DUF5668 domain-containing protein [Bryobacteraceae bacterium]|nr:DUF5668 domain-containing protein [Bryobacteraceae bacterium]
MNCYKHTDVAAVAFCRTCGKPLCQACQRTFQGTIVCEEHAPAAQQVVTPPVAGPGVSAFPPPAPASVAGVSPGLAFILGLIPGVGAIYNGQYAKGIVHVLIFGTLISITSTIHSFEPLFGMLIAIWYFYMPFEAYHTARRRQMGEVPDEFSSLFPLKAKKGAPIGPIVLIGLGVLFLLDTMQIVRFNEIARFWPLALIGIGAYMLYCRMTGCNDDTLPGDEVTHGRR